MEAPDISSASDWIGEVISPTISDQAGMIE
jgi:hypothetical protein